MRWRLVVAVSVCAVLASCSGNPGGAAPSPGTWATNELVDSTALAQSIQRLAATPLGSEMPADLKVVLVPDDSVPKNIETHRELPKPLADAIIASVKQASRSVDTLRVNGWVTLQLTTAGSASVSARKSRVAASSIRNREQMAAILESVAQDAPIGGTVDMCLLVGPDGRIRETQVSRRSASPQLDDLVRESAMSLVFDPSTADDIPVPSWACLPFTIQLR